MTKIIFAPTRAELEQQNLNPRTIRFLEDLATGSSIAVVDESNALNLINAVNNLTSLFRSEIYELKKQVNDLENKGV